MVKSLVTGVFLIAIIQGAAMGFFYWPAGLDFLFLLTVLSMVGISWLSSASLSFLCSWAIQARR